MRNGCRIKKVAFGGNPSFETLLEFKNSEASGLAFCAGGVLIIANDTTAKVVYGNFVKNAWQGVNFNGSMVLVNGYDTPQLVTYSSSGFDCVNALFSGISSPRNLIDAHVFKTRVLYVEKDSADFWYTATNAISGSLTQFPLSRVARGGGKLLAIKSWTVDGGDGPDDYAVFFMSTGEVIVYQGTDPGRSGQWGLVGRYNIPPIIDRRCVVQSAGKIYAITQSDMVILPDVFQQLTPPPSKLTGAISDAWATNSNLRGWQFTVFQSGGIALLNVPTGAATSEQFVINLKTAAATKYTGWNTFCFGEWDNRLYFSPYGSIDLIRADYGIGDELSSGVISPIMARAQTAPSNLGQQQYKFPLDYRMRLSSEGTITLSSGLIYDYSSKPEFYFQTTLPTLGTAWGSAWSSAWSPEDFSKDVWLGASGDGINVQLRNEVRAPQQNLTWHRTDYRFETGPQVN